MLEDGAKTMSEWITHCDRCRTPVRVSITPQERASTPLYCESCFEHMPNDPTDNEPPTAEAFQAPVSPPLPMGSALRFINAAGEQPPPMGGMTTPAELTAAAEQDSFACPACKGTGRVKLGVG